MESPIRVMSHKRLRKKPPYRLGLEMILRRSFMDSLEEYVSCCSLAGVKHMRDPTLGWRRRTFWILVFCTALGVVCYFLHFIWSDTLTKPLIVIRESSTYPISSIDFPAVVICNNNRISKKALVKLAAEENLDLKEKVSLEEMEETLLNWGRLINFSYHQDLMANSVFRKLLEKYRDKNDTVDKIMKMLAPACQDMLLGCAWDGSQVDCKSLFSTNLIANRGHCCTFNYWVTKKEGETKRQKKEGSLHGLNVILDPMLEDYAFPMTATLGFDILILHPDQSADPNAGRVVQRICEPNMAVYFEIKSTRQVATNEVRKYSIENRQCMFHDEDIEDQWFVLYTYSSCIVKCRINTIYSLCKCTPFFFALPDYQKGPVCTLEALKCLNKYREKLFYLYPKNAKTTDGLELELEDSLFCPTCLPDCELTQYTTRSYEIPLKSPFKGKDYMSTFQGDTNMTNKSFLSIYHPIPVANLDRLDVVYYWYEILSSIGGFSGIIIGFSIVSAVEIIYFLTVRFVFHFCSNHKKYH